MWLNGHEWAKRQARRAGVRFTALSNGFASTPEPERLQAICDSLSPEHVQAFFDRWIIEIPTLLSAQDRAAGYWWELSMRQVEVSRTLVLDDPRRARSFFEALVADNIGIGRPEEISLVFARQLRRPTRHPYPDPDLLGRHRGPNRLSLQALPRQAIPQRRPRAPHRSGDHKPGDLDVPARLHNLPQLIDKARAVNQRLLMIERAGQSCAIGSALFERIHQPRNQGGQRTGTLRFGDQRAIALAGALCHLLPAVTGFTNKSLRGLVAGHLGSDYSQSKMSYDLRRLRLHGLIHRLPHKNTYQFTPEGIRVAVFYTKLQNRLLRPMLDAHKPPATTETPRALTTLDHAVADYLQAARLAPAT